jgi:hypothetical protein
MSKNNATESAIKILKKCWPRPHLMLDYKILIRVKFYITVRHPLKWKQLLKPATGDLSRS